MRVCYSEEALKSFRRKPDRHGTVMTDYNPFAMYPDCVTVQWDGIKTFDRLHHSFVKEVK